MSGIKLKSNQQSKIFLMNGKISIYLLIMPVLLLGFHILITVILMTGTG